MCMEIQKEKRLNNMSFTISKFVYTLLFFYCPSAISRRGSESHLKSEVSRRDPENLILNLFKLFVLVNKCTFVLFLLLFSLEDFGSPKHIHILEYS